MKNEHLGSSFDDEMKQAQASTPITKSLRGVLMKTKLNEDDYKKRLVEKHI